jgi:hypothetical protein
MFCPVFLERFTGGGAFSLRLVGVLFGFGKRLMLPYKRGELVSGFDKFLRSLGVSFEERESGRTLHPEDRNRDGGIPALEGCNAPLL